MTTSADPPLTQSGTSTPTPPSFDLDGVSLLLDFDGTLVEIADRPDLVAPEPWVCRELARLHMHLEGRLAIVSGRGAAEVALLLDNPELTIVGSHGAELRFPDGTMVGPHSPTALPTIVGELQRFAASRPSLFVEEKPLGVALHFRGAPMLEAACREFAEQLATEHDMCLQPGKMVFEIRCGEADKGLAVQRLMSRAPMAGTRPIFVGDDRTDEPAFVVAQELGGAGVFIGPPRQTAASYFLPSVQAVHDWLQSLGA